MTVGRSAPHFASKYFTMNWNNHQLWCVHLHTRVNVMNNHRSSIAFLLMILARQASSGSNLNKYYIALTNALNDWKKNTIIIERNDLLKILSEDPRQASLKWEQSKQILYCSDNGLYNAKQMLHGWENEKEWYSKWARWKQRKTKMSIKDEIK